MSPGAIQRSAQVNCDWFIVCLATILSDSVTVNLREVNVTYLSRRPMSCAFERFCSGEVKGITRVFSSNAG